jgi:hypothetical protein
MAQRIMQHQAAIQLAATAPHIYDLKRLHRTMLDALGLEDVEEILPLEEDMNPMDPISENMAVLTGSPVKAFMYQDHDSHIKIHMALAEDPKIAQQLEDNPAAEGIRASGTAHLMEHLAFKYRSEIEQQLGVELPPPDQPLPEDIEVQLSKMVVDAADKLLKRDQAEAEMIKRAAEEEDPVLQLQRREQATKEAEVQRKAKADQDRVTQQERESQREMQLERERIASEERKKGAEIGSRVAQEIISAQLEQGKLASGERLQGASLGVEIAEKITEALLKEQEIKQRGVKETP